MLNKRIEWQALKAHQQEMRDIYMRDLFAKDSARFDKFHINLDGLLFDYSKHRITEETIEKLVSLARACDVEPYRDQMFAGEHINKSEDRAALHPALRGFTKDEEVAEFVQDTLARMKNISDAIRSEGQFTDIVHLGIGGSDLGPHMVCEALKAHADGPKVYFVSNIDGTHLTQTLKNLNPETTLFIIASKTFTTLETMANAKTAKDWLGGKNHFIAVTANAEAAKSFGVEPDNILPMRDWIGGRYSLWSSIGLPIAISIDFDQFEQLLAGAHKADEHFQTAPLEKNIPVLMALLGIWYRNFWDYRSHAILPYAQNLHRLPAYLQQLEMESNGKSIDQEGKHIDYQTSPVIFGEPGTNAQHAFLQMLHQGTDIIPSDFVTTINANHDLQDHHTQLLANAVAQSQALMAGHTDNKEPYKNCEGNRPSSTILLNQLDAHHLGMLLALYEHKIFVQGCIWNINSFDQWGVELGKDLAKETAQYIENNEEPAELDSSTQNLLIHIQKQKK